MSTALPCSICADLKEFQTAGSWIKLEQRARWGCKGCSLLLAGVTQLKIDSSDVDSFRIHVDLSLYLSVFSSRQSWTGSRTVEFYTEKGRPSEWRKIGPARHVLRDSNNDGTVVLMKTWLRDCLESHPACEEAPLSRLPTRLIAVGDTDDDVHLHEPCTEEHARYVALSHRWGDVHPQTTTSLTIDRYKKHIGFDEDSILFQQAVHVTRRLGIPYVWIDSLCIIQDVREDWQKEACNMTNVYNNAAVTIFAHNSSDNSSPLFPSGLWRNESIELDLPAGESGTHQGNPIFVRECYNYPYPLSQSYHTQSFPERSVLDSRGWILQEGLLSPRCLHFHAEEISWTCSTCSRCECRFQPSVPPSSLFRSPPKVLIPGPSETEEPNESFGLDKNEVQVEGQQHAPETASNEHYSDEQKYQLLEREKIYELLIEWNDLVMDFTRRDLTQPNDFLFALAGLAGYMKKVTGKGYASGLWLCDLPDGLLWFRDWQDQPLLFSRGDVESTRESDRELYESRHSFAPSWSWASLPSNAAVSYLSRYKDQSSKHFLKYNDNSVETLMRDKDFVNIFDGEVWARSSDSYGWGPGVLTISCRCVFLKRYFIEPAGLEDIFSECTLSVAQTGRTRKREWKWVVVDETGEEGGSRPFDLDLERMEVAWDFDLDGEDMTDRVVDRSMDKDQSMMIFDWEVDRAEDNVSRIAGSKQIDTPVDEESERQGPVLMAGHEVKNDDHQDKSKVEDIDTNSNQDEGSVSPRVRPQSDDAIFTLVLVAVLHWKDGFTSLPLEGVCLLLEDLEPQADIYRRIGFVTGAGSSEAWKKCVKQRIIHIV